MSGARQPSFLDGTFDWSGRGYRLAAPAPVDLLDARTLQHADPRICLAAHLEHAKIGDAPALAPLVRLLDDAIPLVLGHATLDLIADAGTEDDALALVDVMQDECRPVYLRMAAASACLHTGLPWMVDALLEFWRGCGGRNRGAVSYYLSELLEEELEDEAVPVATYEGFASDEAYVEFVRARGDAVDSGGGPVFHGRVFDVVEFARYLRARVGRADGGGPAWAGMPVLRRRFEAATGVDCASWFEKGRFQAMSVATSLDAFLGKSTAGEYMRGRRYFWGRAITGGG